MAYILRVRSMVKDCCASYLEHVVGQVPALDEKKGNSMALTHTLAFEIGTEEIPAFDLDSAGKQLQKMVPAAFEGARIPFESFEIYSSPRRLIVMAYGVADATEALVEEYKGPAIKIAFDASGAPTKAAQGFARGKGVAVEDLERREVDGVEYVFATKTFPPRPWPTCCPPCWPDSSRL